MDRFEAKCLPIFLLIYQEKVPRCYYAFSVTIYSQLFTVCSSFCFILGEEGSIFGHSPAQWKSDIFEVL